MKRITLTLPAPYIGLRPFGEREAVLFFGRDQHIRELLSKLEGKQRFIAVLGASGTGKSSLVRAGVVPALHRGALASAGHSWNVCIFKPGDAPLTNLAQELIKHPGWMDSDDRADAVASLSASLAMSPLALTELYRQKTAVFDGQALLLVVDQFEEIFRYRQKNVDEAEAFINLLLRSASEDVPIYVVITMRSDFLGNLVAFFGLPEAVNHGIYLTPRLGPDQLKSVITSPLALVGGEIDPVLVNKLVNTLEGEDELPIMEHALLRMWNLACEAGRARIEQEDFEAVCAPHEEPIRIDGSWRVPEGQPRLSNAIDNHASEIYDALSSQGQFIARRLFLALVERRDGRDVRRPRALKQLVEEVGEAERNNLLVVIDAFRAQHAGFLLPSESELLKDATLIDISHESLFRRWHLLQRWLSEEELDAAELKEWQQRAARQKEGGGWLDKYDCARAHRWRARVNERTKPAVWATRYGGPVTYAEMDEYINGSVERVKLAQDEQERLEREARDAETRRLELEAKVQREAAEQAEAERLLAEVEKQQAQANAAISHRRTILAVAGMLCCLLLSLALGSFYRDKTRALGMALDAISGELTAKAENLSAHSPDKSTLLALEAWQIRPIGTAQALIRAALGDYSVQTVLRGHEGEVTSAQFAADGKTVVTAGEDGTVRLWDVTSGEARQVLRGHEGGVTSAQFAPDGKTVMTVGGDGTVRLWDVTSGEARQILRGHEGGITSAQFAPDGKTVVTAGRDGTVRLWDVTSGEARQVLRGQEGVVWSAQFAPDGKMAVTVGGDGTVRLWDVTSGEARQVLRGQEGGVTSAQFAPDGKTVVTAGRDGTVRLWDVTSGEARQVLRGQEGVVWSAQFAPDGQTVVTVGGDGTVRLWDVMSGGARQVLQGPEGGVTSAQFAPDGKTVVTAGGDGTVRLWDVTSGEARQVLRGHEGGITSAQFAPDGQTVVTAGEDGTARLWDMMSGGARQVLQGHEGVVWSAQFAPDGKTVMTVGGGFFGPEGTVGLWDVASGEARQVLRGPKGGITSAQFAPDGKTVMTVGGGFFGPERTVRLWDVASGEARQVLREQKGGVARAQFAPDGKMVMTVGGDGTVRLWDVMSGGARQVLQGPEGGVTSAQFAPDGKTVMTAGWDGTVRLWDVMSGEARQVLQGPKGEITSAQFAPDGKTVMTVGGGFFGPEGTVRLWDVMSGEARQVLRGQKGGVARAQFALDGKMVMTVGGDGTVRLWDVASGKERQVLRGQKGGITSAQFAPDGKTVVTAGRDGTARLWDVASGKELQVLRGHEGWVTSAQFAPDGQTVVTAGRDGTARLWDCQICRPIDEIVVKLKKAIGRDLTADEAIRFGVQDAMGTTKK